MDPETQRLFMIALVGLLLFFPVFNEVAWTAVSTLKDADHQAQMDEFFKKWDHIPDDRKLEYWDGRNPPPGHSEGQGGDHNPRIGEGGGQGGNGEGGTGQGGEGEEGETEPVQEQRVVYEERVLWQFDHNDEEGYRQDSLDLPQGDYHWVNVSYDYTMFTGSAEFELTVGNDEGWYLPLGDEVPVTMASGDGNKTIPDVGTAPLRVKYEYDPSLLSVGTSFIIVITGTYPVVLED